MLKTESGISGFQRFSVAFCFPDFCFSDQRLPTALAWAKLFPEGSRNFGALKEILFVLGCLVVLSLGLLLWAAYVRKRQDRSRHSPRSRNPGGTSPRADASAADEKGSEPRRRRHRHRRRRSSRYPLNPTLAQTGGLPPVRREEPPAPPGQPGTQPQ